MKLRKIEIRVPPWISDFIPISVHTLMETYNVKKSMCKNLDSFKYLFSIIYIPSTWPVKSFFVDPEKYLQVGKENMEKMMLLDSIRFDWSAFFRNPNLVASSLASFLGTYSPELDPYKIN